MKIVVAGQGAFGVKHIEAIQKINGITIASLAGGSPDTTADVARKYGIPHWTTNLHEALSQPGVEAETLLQRSLVVKHALDEHQSTP